MSSSAGNVVTTDIRGGVAFLLLDNPPVNALSRDLRIGLLDAILAAAEKKDVQAIVLMGAKDSFIAGADLKEFGQPLTRPTLPEVISAIEACAKPIIAAIHGMALGGGYEVSLACDGRIATADAAIGLPEGTFGIIPGSGGALRATRLTDAATVLEMLSSCRRIKAPEAIALGLIDRIATELRAEAAAFALSLVGTKRRLRDLPPNPVDAAALEKAAQAALRKGRNRPFVHEQIASMRRATSEPFDTALAADRAAFERLRETAESAALRHLFFAEREAARVDGLGDVRGLPVRSVGIVGAGTMGSGIAAAFLTAGIPVTLIDFKPEVLVAASERIHGFIAKAPRAAALTLGGSLSQLSGCDVLLEAVFEDMSVKQALVRDLAGIAKADAILASNTSYLDLDEIAAASGCPDRVVGLHFFAPAHIMKLLEIVRGSATSAEVLATALAIGRRLGKVSVVSRVCEGFIGNRIYNAYRAACEELLLTGALPEDVDTAIESFGFAMGPFAVSDMSGLDIAWANRKRKQAETGNRHADFPVLEWLVEGGRLGRKSGRGWYAYDSEGKRSADHSVAMLIERARKERSVAGRTLEPQEIQTSALAAIVNEALLVLEDKIAQRPSDIDLVLVNGYGFPRHLGGPLHWAKSLPRTELDAALDTAAKRSKHGRRGSAALMD